MKWTPTVERHDISSGAGAHDDLVVFTTPILPSHSSPKLTTSSVRWHEYLCVTIYLHGRLVRVIDETETLDVLSANVASVAGLR